MGFFELLIIGIVGLLVIGPERLPETLRTLALWWGRLKRGLQSTRAELEQHLGADDIRRQLHNEEVMRRLNATKSEIERTLRESTSLIDTDPTDATKQPSSAQQDSEQPRAEQPSDRAPDSSTSDKPSATDLDPPATADPEPDTRRKPDLE